ncbi:hypothetical protein QBC33DRAFT_212727 [Phialemonium atrogriseum]|uniref:DUF6546 domain-containing protein n=1 Tax=Phialemonium atrogriseum TaxID=1093897 RepID=A0AAJ0BSY3_9PEZI|nr:uncharacterized protein QBC33DRAFT_212727 [Phialemonium atrogriseum]KAK1763865.1 hypothetical protein QBC33DRAFT_212727 [Phialemonium atrogriseum]
MRELHVSPSRAAPDGRWLLDRDDVIARDLDRNPPVESPFEVLDMSAPDAPALEDRPWKTFRVRASTEATHDLLLSAAQAAKRMPELKTCHVGVTCGPGGFLMDYSAMTSSLGFKVDHGWELEAEMEEAWRGAFRKHRGSGSELDVRVEARPPSKPDRSIPYYSSY